MIPFTQYLRPRGETRSTGIERPPEVEAKALQLVEAGCLFTVEVLLTDEVSMTCERSGQDDEAVEVLSCEVASNGPRVPAAVDKLVETAYAAAKVAGILTAARA